MKNVWLKRKNEKGRVDKLWGDSALSYYTWSGCVDIKINSEHVSLTYSSSENHSRAKIARSFHKVMNYSSYSDLNKPDNATPLDSEKLTIIVDTNDGKWIYDLSNPRGQFTRLDKQGLLGVCLFFDEVTKIPFLPGRSYMASIEEYEKLNLEKEPSK
jgi:hypothetical protein